MRLAKEDRRGGNSDWRGRERDSERGVFLITTVV